VLIPQPGFQQFFRIRKTGKNLRRVTMVVHVCYRPDDAMQVVTLCASGREKCCMPNNNLPDQVDQADIIGVCPACSTGAKGQIPKRVCGSGSRCHTEEKNR
jgi:hypothetical protein